MSATHRWKERLTWNEDGYFEMAEEGTGGVPVRLFLTPSLLEELEDTVRAQILTATRFPGVKLVVITPEVEHELWPLASLKGL